MNGNENKDKAKTVKKILAVAKFAFLLAIIVGIPVYLYAFHKEQLMEFRDLEYAKQVLASYHKRAVFVYLATQILQILISVIPGQALQIAAGFVFGIPLGFLYSVIGALIGSILTYYLGKYLGKDAVELFFGEERTERYVRQISSKRGVLIVFLLYLLPGLPKDVINYIAGVSNMRPRLFLTVSMIGRIPGMLGSLVIGRQVSVGGYTSAAVIMGVAAVIFAIGVWQRERIMGWFDTWYDKLT